MLSFEGIQWVCKRSYRSLVWTCESHNWTCKSCKSSDLLQVDVSRLASGLQEFPGLTGLVRAPVGLISPQRIYTPTCEFRRCLKYLTGPAPTPEGPSRRPKTWCRPDMHLSLEAACRASLGVAIEMASKKRFPAKAILQARTRPRVFLGRPRKAQHSYA